MESNRQINGEITRNSASTSLDALLDRIYNYHGEYAPPGEVITDTWAAPTDLLEQAADRAGYFLHYFQSQGLGPTPNECVTASTVMAMNMIEDRIASRTGGGLRFQAGLYLERFILDLEARGMAGWQYRFPTKSPLPGMMMPAGSRRAMREHAEQLRKKLGRGYQVGIRSHLKLGDLLQAMEQGLIIMLHGAWQKRLSDANDRHLALLGGMPHTMLLAGYEAAQDTWSLLNPAEPWIKSRLMEAQPRLFRMSTQQLMDFWGRKFLFYPPRFSITTLREEL